MGVMKMENIVPRAGIEPIPLAFQTIVLPISPSRIPDVTTNPRRLPYVWLLAQEVSADYHSKITKLHTWFGKLQGTDWLLQVSLEKSLLKLWKPGWTIT